MGHGEGSPATYRLAAPRRNKPAAAGFSSKSAAPIGALIGDLNVMKIQVLVAGVAAIALAATGASAATKHHAASTGGKYAEPSQPIAYSKLDAYLKATPSQRAKGDWSNDSTTAAATGSGADVSATAPAAASPPMTNPASPQTANPATDTQTPDTAQPASPATPPGDASAPPPVQTPTTPDAAPATPQQ
jgi:hypothetical protein